MRRHPQSLTPTSRGGGSRDRAIERQGPDDLWARPPLRSCLTIVVATLLAGLVAAVRPTMGRSRPRSGVGARLRPTSGSAIAGLVTFQPYEGGVTAAASFYAGVTGNWLVVIHTTGICTSPNGFSAGPPWIPSGATEPPTIQMTTHDNDYASSTIRLPGLKIDGTDGIRGKSVVVHLGTTGSLDAQPGVPNNRVACGVIETNKPLSF
jgi:Cu/Zn superoxide dismutase